MKQTENNIIDSSVCKNCGSENTESYCAKCGQKTYTERFTLKAFFRVFLNAFDIEKGFFYTLKMLFIDPGKIVHEYLNGRTKDYFNPLKYLIIIAGIDAILMVWLNVFDADMDNTSKLLRQIGEPSELQQKLTLFTKQYLNLISILMVPFISLVSKWYYKKHKLFYGEHLIIICFLYAQILIIAIAIYPIYLVFPALYNYVILIPYVILVLYFSYALYKIFKSTFFKSFIGAILINVIGAIFFFIFFLIVMMSVLYIMAKMGYPIGDLL